MASPSLGTHAALSLSRNVLPNCPLHRPLGVAQAQHGLCTLPVCAQHSYSQGVRREFKYLLHRSPWRPPRWAHTLVSLSRVAFSLTALYFAQFAAWGGALTYWWVNRPQGQSRICRRPASFYSGDLLTCWGICCPPPLLRAGQSTGLTL